MNRRAKFDAASFILAGEIRNRTNTNKQTDYCHCVMNQDHRNCRYMPIHTVTVGLYVKFTFDLETSFIFGMISEITNRARCLIYV